MSWWRERSLIGKIGLGILGFVVFIVVLAAIFGEVPETDAVGSTTTTAQPDESTLTSAADTTTSTEATTTTTLPTTTTTRPGGDIEADIRYDVEGLHITARIRAHTGCTIDLNPGLIRSGYTRSGVDLPEDEEVLVPWAMLTNRDNERFDIFTHEPDRVSIDCDDDWLNIWTFN